MPEYENVNITLKRNVYLLFQLKLTVWIKSTFSTERIFYSLEELFKRVCSDVFFFLFIYCHREQSPFRQHIGKESDV